MKAARERDGMERGAGFDTQRPEISDEEIKPCRRQPVESNQVRGAATGGGSCFGTSGGLCQPSKCAALEQWSTKVRGSLKPRWAAWRRALL
ncbi:MAG: hypothetical protein AAFU77_17345, partial [Myxococcota bacterium]